MALRGVHRGTGETSRDDAGARFSGMLVGWDAYSGGCRRGIAATVPTIAEAPDFRLNGAGDFLERFH